MSDVVIPLRRSKRLRKLKEQRDISIENKLNNNNITSIDSQMHMKPISTSNCSQVPNAKKSRNQNSLKNRKRTRNETQEKLNDRKKYPTFKSLSPSPFSDEIDDVLCNPPPKKRSKPSQSPLNTNMIENGKNSQQNKNISKKRRKVKAGKEEMDTDDDINCVTNETCDENVSIIEQLDKYKFESNIERNEYFPSNSSSKDINSALDLNIDDIHCLSNCKRIESNSCANKTKSMENVNVVKSVTNGKRKKRKKRKKKSRGEYNCEQMKVVFNILDVEGNGYLSVSNIMQGFRAIEKSNVVSRNIAHAMLLFADERGDNDKQVSFSDFLILTQNAGLCKANGEE